MQKWNIARVFQQTHVITSPEYGGILIRTINTWKVTRDFEQNAAGYVSRVALISLLFISMLWS